MSKRAKSGSVTCSLSGELTIYAVRDQIRILRECLEKKPAKLELNLSAVTEMDTAGLQVLLWLNKTCNEINIAWLLRDKSEAVSQFLDFSRCSYIGQSAVLQEGN